MSRTDRSFSIIGCLCFVIGNILSANAGRIEDEDLTNLGWLISILSSTVDGLIFIGGEAGAILERPEKEVNS